MLRLAPPLPPGALPRVARPRRTGATATARGAAYPPHVPGSILNGAGSLCKPRTTAPCNCQRVARNRLPGGVLNCVWRRLGSESAFSTAQSGAHDHLWFDKTVAATAHSVSETLRGAEFPRSHAARGTERINDTVWGYNFSISSIGKPVLRQMISGGIFCRFNFPAIVIFSSFPPSFLPSSLPSLLPSSLAVSNEFFKSR